MSLHKVKKVVIITEKIISDQICKLVDDSSASGYTIASVGGKGSRNVRTESDGASVVGGFSNVKIEAIVKDNSVATPLVEAINERFFKNYSGIAFIEDVEILRLHKFVVE
ncbi:MAG: hypothetical protein AB8E15_11655 [Bdellovibrionales bacterium]